MESSPRTVEVDEIHDRRINRMIFHTNDKNTFSRSHTDAEVCDYAKRSRQSFSRIHIQLDTVAERPSTNSSSIARCGCQIIQRSMILHASTSLGELSIVLHEIHGSLLWLIVSLSFGARNMAVSTVIVL
ncbi:hypothetical protein ALC57_03830 [Trachymyrmex cornetzi]|uniref:Uncharacterized protein n=1 Tax=Trachymyrmex cornetzi TaxID=471704 RepID=A0A195EFW9_9HYME|nr:hypothetical protein ALC57_03830 [Trachymyrmex cornetzi]